MTDWAEEFLDLFYHDEILILGTEWPGKSSLLIDIDLLSRYSIDKYSQIVERPDTVITDLESALKEWSFPFDVTDFAPLIRIYSSEIPLRIRDLRHTHIGSLVSMSGIVQKITEVWPRITEAAFKCRLCGYVTTISQNGNRFAEPLECESEGCGRKGPFILQLNESKFVDLQRLRIQESPEDLKGGEQPQSLDIEIEGDITGQIMPGNRVIVTGTLRSFQRISRQVGKTTQFDKMLEGRYIEVSETDAELIISDEDKRQIRELADRSDIVDILVDRFADSIYGYRALKEAMLVCAVSGENQIRQDGTIQRGYAHLLICGDPSTAKSTLLQNLAQLIPGAQVATGDGATKAGLTASVVRDDFYGAKWSVEAGALVMADKSLAIVDELDKLRTEDVPKLNTALSRSTVLINKAGINCILWARCPIICAMNPKGGRFDPYEPLATQVTIRPDTLSRYDLIYLMRDIPNKEVDEHIADTLVSTWCGDGEDIDIDLLRKYLATAKQIKAVSVSADAQAMIKQYYTSIRGRYNPGDDVISITTRYLEALIRLARAEAKLRLSTVAETQDVQRAIKLIEESMEQTCIDEKGRTDIDRVEVGIGKSQREMIKAVLGIIHDLQDNGGAKYADIVLRANEAGIGKDRFEKALEVLKRQGDVFEAKSGFFRVVV